MRKTVRCAMVLLLLRSATCTASEPLERVLACRSTALAAARLDCFDRAAAAAATDLGEASAGSAPSAARIDSAAPAASAVAATSRASGASAAEPGAPAPPQRDPRAQFGLSEKAVAAKEVAAGTRAAELAKIEARVAALAEPRDGHAVFSLDNGQVWRQIDAEGDVPAKVGDAVTLSRGVLGSYWLKIQSGRAWKVARTR